MHLVAPDAPILHRVCRPDFVLRADWIEQMFALMYRHNSLGLAAPQIGLDARLFVTHWGEVFVNPKVIGCGERRSIQEGCLSLPGCLGVQWRFARILVDGRGFYRGERAIVIQHEMDHLNGRLITDA
jgi:peptide deformylase